MKKFKEYLQITFGVLILAFATQFFLVPNKIAAGGVTGIAIIINHFVPFLPIGSLMLGMNLILFIIAFIVIGPQFGGKTIFASLGLSGSIWALEAFFGTGIAITRDPMLATIFGTLISGIGMGVVFNANSSTGGTDILAKILNKFVEMDIGKSLLMVDFVVTITAGLTFGADVGMYALLAVVLNGFVIDYVIEGLNVTKQVMVVSNKFEAIGDYIMKDLDRGCTLLEGKGGYSHNKTPILYAVVNRKEFIRLKNYIREVDPSAFISVIEVHEVLGNGFKDIT